MDDEGFLRGIEGYLSTRFEAAVTVERLQRPTATGFSAETVLLDVDGLADVSRLVVQAAPQGPALFADYDLERTFRVQRELAAFEVPVAWMRWLCEDTTWIGRPFYVMDFVPGRVPPDRPPYHVSGWLHDAPVAVRERVWLAGIEAMAALHAVPISGFGFLREDGPTDSADQRLWRWRRFGADLGPDVEPALMVALDRLEVSRPAPAESRVHWGDAKLGNMMFDESGVAAIFDWELCGLSDGEEDLAHWMAVDWFLSTGIGHERLGGLPGAGATVEWYEAVTGRATASVEWWFAFALVRMGLIFQRAAVQSRRRQGEQGPLRPNTIASHLGAILDGTAWDRYQTT